jgi:hypothetical protein|tara:strand:- start:207 stop:515 length:309 start_codon:yes stop_codon:yes gene_type:complete
VKHTNIRQQDLFLNEAPYAFEYDFSRLKTARDKVYTLMKDSKWRTLKEISLKTGSPEASASALLRDFRKAKYGMHIVDRRIKGTRTSGLWEYKLTENIADET